MKIESALYNELSTEQLDVSSQLIKLNGYICLFGTNDAGLNRIYSKSLNDRLKSKLGLSGEVKIYKATTGEVEEEEDDAKFFVKQPKRKSVN